jgi:3-oxoacyl-[acyl-carrier protein] reductase
LIKLDNKNAIVTGGAKGIGAAIALKLAQAGCNVLVSDIDESGAQNIAKKISELGRKSLAIRSDVSNLADAEKMISTAVQELGSIDILVNNAGITRDNLLMRMSEAEWDSVININLKGTFNCVKAASRTMLKQRSGKIINLASVVGVMGNAGQVNYSASKAGVIGLTKSVAKEFGPRNIQVNAIAPGYIETDMTKDLPEGAKNAFIDLIPAKRAGQSDDVANTVLFLASELSSYITGQVIHVDGGMVM